MITYCAFFLQTGFRTLGGDLTVDHILALCNGTYSSTNPLKVTILAPILKHLSGSLFIRELAKQLACFDQLKVSMLVPETTLYNQKDEAEAKEIGVAIFKAERPPGYSPSNSIDWLNHQPANLDTDVVVGIGRELGKIAQNWKANYQCKSIQISSENVHDWEREHDHVFQDFIGRGSLFEKNSCRNNLRELSQTSDISVAIGPKTTDHLTADLRSKGKEMYNLTPGLLSTYCNLNHGSKDLEKFRILFVGEGNPKNFQNEGLELAAKVMTELNDKSFQLVYVGAENDTEAKQIATVFQQNGVSKRQLDICPSPKTEADWKNRLLQVDLAIMPSGEKEFGMEALVALSAGLPLLVHGESGFGESLKNITWGRSAVVDSDNAKDWASKIKNIRETDRKTRLEQAALLRSSYDEKYSWQNQCRSLIVLIFLLFSGIFHSLSNKILNSFLSCKKLLLNTFSFPNTF